jgi:hypothetical protein
MITRLLDKFASISMLNRPPRLTPPHFISVWYLYPTEH